MSRRWFAVEAALLCAPAVLFLGATLPEVLRTTLLMLHLRATTQSQLSVVQSTSACLQWGAGTFALVVLTNLAVASARRRRFTYSALFWVGLLAGLASTWLMVGPFGAMFAFVVAGPLFALALHSAYVQAHLRAEL